MVSSIHFPPFWNNSIDINYLESLCMKDSSIFTIYIINPFICKGTQVLALYFGLWSNLILLYLFCCSYCSRFGHWNLFQLSCVLFIYSQHCRVFKNPSFLSVAKRCIRSILCIFSPRFRISHFSKASWFLFLENGAGNQDLGTKYAHWYWSVITLRTCQSREQ